MWPFATTGDRLVGRPCTHVQPVGVRNCPSGMASPTVTDRLHAVDDWIDLDRWLAAADSMLRTTTTWEECEREHHSRPSLEIGARFRKSRREKLRMVLQRCRTACAKNVSLQTIDI
jgi:hypothetical protein